MARSKYSNDYIAAVKAGNAQLPADPGQAKYVQRLARNYSQGISRSQARGHARTKIEAPISKIKQEKGIARNATIAKPLVPVAQRRKVSRPHVQNVYRKSDTEKKTPVGKVVNARNEMSLGKQVDRLPDNSKVFFHVINTRKGEEVRAVPNKGVTASDLRKAIATSVAQGKTQKEAFRDALSRFFTFYGTDVATGVRTSEELDALPDDVSNFVMYTTY